MDYLEARVLQCVQNYKGREVVIWGTGENQKLVESYLDAQRIMKKHVVDSVAVNNDVLKPDILIGNTKQYYVIVSYKEQEKDVIKFLEKQGYDWGKDYSYIPQLRNPKWNKLSGRYFEDEYGNRVIGNLQGIEIQFYGYCSEVKVLGTIRNYGSRIRMYSNARLEIGDGVAFRSYVIEGQASKIMIENNASLKIEEKVTFGGNNYFAINSYTHCIIGKDCMFSSNTIVRPSDAHPIIDEQTGKVTNSPMERDVCLCFGEHVWVGERAQIIHGVKIGNGVIIGAGSLVNKDIPDRCMVAGVPAKVIKDNVLWEREFDF